ncbi:hypothetical protein BRC81_06575 [Halobacteriales archaeon QS_1_68_20]|nr:MAG: hypothetical protein BRC81_06575 [Halobacteriales archaeon QS_1_68_20]
MSADRIQRIDHDDGVTVVHERTGVSGSGETYSEALESLVHRFQTTTDLVEFVENATEIVSEAADPQEAADELRELRDTATLVDMSREVQRRFADEDVTEDDVEDAIRWARSQ